MHIAQRGGWLTLIFLESPRLNFWIPADDADVGVPEVSFRVDMMVLVGGDICVSAVWAWWCQWFLEKIHGEIFYFFFSNSQYALALFFFFFFFFQTFPKAGLVKSETLPREVKKKSLYGTELMC